MQLRSSAMANKDRTLVRLGEFAVEAERIWRQRGSRRTAYDSIVGSGPNSTILHYPRSERVMRDGELILMDMAVEYAHYATDITRTLPVNGRFTPEQRKIYDIVLRAQDAAWRWLNRAPPSKTWTAPRARSSTMPAMATTSSTAWATSSVSTCTTPAPTTRSSSRAWC